MLLIIMYIKNMFLSKILCRSQLTVFQLFTYSCQFQWQKITISATKCVTNIKVYRSFSVICQKRTFFHHSSTVIIIKISAVNDIINKCGKEMVFPTLGNLSKLRTIILFSLAQFLVMANTFGETGIWLTLHLSFCVSFKN